MKTRVSLSFLAILLAAALSRANGEASLPSSALFQQALEAYLDEHYEQSVHLFERALEQDPRNDMARLGLRSARQKYGATIQRLRAQERPALESARAFRGRKQWVQAADRLKRILARVPDYPQAEAELVKVRRAVERLQRKAKPDGADHTYLQGALAYLGGDWIGAIHRWEQVYAFDPDRVSVANDLDRARRHLQDQQRMERMALNRQAAWDHMKQARYAEAIQAWGEILKLDAGNREAQEGILQSQRALSQAAARRQAERSRAADARRRFRAAPIDEAGPEKSDWAKATEFLAQKHYADALDYLDRHLRDHPNDEKAKTAVREAQKEQAVLAERHYQRGLELYSQGRPEEAMQDWQYTLEVDPYYYKARMALIKALAAQKKS
jgi:tetratricopeptide (TPR) repeat protein